MFYYQTEIEFEKVMNLYFMSKCSKCDGIVEVDMEHVCVNVLDKIMDIEEMPMLKCKTCGEIYYSRFAQEILCELYSELKRTGNREIYSTSRDYNKIYNYASNKNFIYDYKDYESIPGLRYDFEHSEEGFLTPVYFDKKALLYFIADLDYDVDMFSESYGYIRKNDKEGFYQYEWAVPFGFNTNEKLIFWLGDIDSMDDMSQGILKSFNVKSDHLLIDSEFYQAQMNCIPSKPIKEQQIILNKKSFITNIKKKYGIELSHLQNECELQRANVKRPVVFDEKSISEVINAFDKILIEGFSVSGLKSLYKRLYASSYDKDYDKWKSIRLIEEILRQLSNDISNEININEIISPLYILHDYRIYLDHLLSQEEQDKKRNHIANTLGVNNFSEQEKIYFEEIRRLDILFQCLVILSK